MAPDKSYLLTLTATNDGSQEGYQRTVNLSCLQNEQTLPATQIIDHKHDLVQESIVVK